MSNGCHYIIQHSITDIIRASLRQATRGNIGFNYMMQQPCRCVDEMKMEAECEHGRVSCNINTEESWVRMWTSSGWCDPISRKSLVYFFIFPLISIISVTFLSDLSQKTDFNIPGVPCQRKVKAPVSKKVDSFVVFWSFIPNTSSIVTFRCRVRPATPKGKSQSNYYTALLSY